MITIIGFSIVLGIIVLLAVLESTSKNCPYLWDFDICRDCPLQSNSACYGEEKSENSD